MNSIEDRLDTLESLVDDQQAQIEAHEETIAAQQATIEAQRERIAAVENDGGVSMPISRRGALTAGGALGLLGLGTGTASAQGSGQIGTGDTPVDTIYVETLSGGITDEEISELVGFGLKVYEPDGRLDVDWGDADGLNDDGEIDRQERWVISPGIDTTQPSLFTNDYPNVFISNIKDVGNIHSSSGGNDSLTIHFGGDELELNDATSGNTTLNDIKESIEVTVGTTTYYIPLYELS